MAALAIQCGHLSAARPDINDSSADRAVSEAPNLNTGEPWAEIDNFDLRYGVEHGDDAAKLADFLCRTVAEVRTQAREFGLGEFP